MGIFKIGKKKSFTVGRELSVDRSSWRDVLSESLGYMMAVQLAFGEIAVRDRDWDVDFSRGVIAFGEDEYPIQFIGSQSDVSNTWLWAWENINGFDSSLLELAEKTKQRGNEWGLEPLTKAQSNLDTLLSGHTIASVACAISEEKLCYYRCPYSGGAAFVAVRGVDEAVFSGADIAAFAEITMKCISEFDLDHRIFAESFLLSNRTPYEWGENVLIAHFDRDLYIEFENKKGVLRIASIKTK